MSTTRLTESSEHSYRLPDYHLDAARDAVPDQLGVDSLSSSNPPIVSTSAIVTSSPGFSLNLGGLPCMIPV